MRLRSQFLTRQREDDQAMAAIEPIACERETSNHRPFRCLPSQDTGGMPQCLDGNEEKFKIAVLENCRKWPN